MSLNKDQIIEAISSMSLMDIVELVAAMEKKFGVSANAIYSLNNNSDTIDINNNSNTSTVEEKTEFNVILKVIGSNKIATIKAVRNITGLGLKEAKTLVDSVPSIIKEGISKIDAESLKKSLEEVGAEVEIK